VTLQFKNPIRFVRGQTNRWNKLIFFLAINNHQVFEAGDAGRFGRHPGRLRLPTGDRETLGTVLCDILRCRLSIVGGRFGEA
jgi:hypothetical protein